jgi:1,2-phenylacetyl-CoA epoxidase PaaB subunit
VSCLMDRPWRTCFEIISSWLSENIPSHALRFTLFAPFHGLRKVIWFRRLLFSASPRLWTFLEAGLLHEQYLALSPAKATTALHPAKGSLTNRQRSVVCWALRGCSIPTVYSTAEGETCSTHVERCETDTFWFEHQKERGHFEDLVKDGKIILSCTVS